MCLVDLGDVESEPTGLLSRATSQLHLYLHPGHFAHWADHGGHPSVADLDRLIAQDGDW
jgi:hypothetical protein